MAQQTTKVAPAPTEDLEGLVSSDSKARIETSRRKTQAVLEIIWVLPENWPAIELFRLCRSCWQYSFSGPPIGMCYEAVDIVIKRCGLDPFPPEDFKRFMRLEHYFLTQLSE